MKIELAHHLSNDLKQLFPVVVLFSTQLHSTNKPRNKTQAPIYQVLFRNHVCVRKKKPTHSTPKLGIKIQAMCKGS